MLSTDDKLPTAKKSTSKKSAKKKLPSILAYSGSICPSPALLDGMGRQNEYIGPVVIEEKTVKGAMGSAARGGSPDQLKSLEYANIQRVDTAHLPPGATKLRTMFSLKITSDLLAPYSCNDQAYRKQLNAYTQAFIAHGGMKILAGLYADQILSGDWLWRNKDAIDALVTVCTRIRGQAEEITTRDIYSGAGLNHEALVNAITRVFEGKSRIAYMSVSCISEMMEFSEVYPSQEFIDPTSQKGSSSQSSKQKTLFSISQNGVNQAAVHSQKIGNALRRIDSWHKGPEGRVIPIEMWGVDQQNYTAYRTKGNSFYDFARDLDGMLADLNTNGPTDNHLYFVACLVRGGVMGEK